MKMSRQLKSLRSINLFDQTNVQLNKDLNVIIVPPHETLIFKYGAKIDEITTKIFPNPNWVSDKDSLEKVNEVEQAILTYCIRHPDDARRFLIVPDDQEPNDYQVRFSDFNPSLDGEILRKQGHYAPIDSSYIPPKLTLLFLAINKKGVANGEEQEAVESTAESFPSDAPSDQTPPSV
jgi:hypothetical protein